MAIEFSLKAKSRRGTSARATSTPCRPKLKERIDQQRRDSEAVDLFALLAPEGYSIGGGVVLRACLPAVTNSD